MRFIIAILAAVLLVAANPPLPAGNLVKAASDNAAPLPAQPQRFSDYPAATAAFLNERPENLTRLKALLLSWNAVSPATPVFAGDAARGRMDLFVAITQAVQGRGANDKLGGILWLFQPAGGTWQGRFLARPDFPTGPALRGQDPTVRDLQIHYVGDLTGDGQDEVLWSAGQFGANTGFQRVRAEALEQDAWKRVWSFEQVWGGVLVDPGLEPRTIQLMPGFAGSWGAGPQRRVTQWYTWDGKNFALSRQFLGSNPYMPLRFVDAEWDLLAGHQNEALDRYREVLSDAALQTWPETNPAYSSFYRTLAAFRLMAETARQGDRAKAERLAQTALSGYEPLVPVVRAFADTYADRGDYRQACKAAHRKWPGPANPSRPPYYWGYENPPITGAMLCPDVFGYTLAKGTPEAAQKTLFQ